MELGSEDVHKIISMLNSEDSALLYEASGGTKNSDLKPLSGEKHQRFNDGTAMLDEKSGLKHTPDDSTPNVSQDFDGDSQSLDADDSEEQRKKNSMLKRSLSLSAESPKDFWMTRFNDLKQFHDENGHINLSYLNHSQLYSWLHRQKYLSRKGKLSRNREELLASLGVQFDYHWDEMLKMLKDFKEQHDSFKVPVEMDPKLSYWVWTQVYAWKNEKLPEEKIKKLVELGLSCDQESSLRLCKNSPRPTKKRKRRDEDGETSDQQMSQDSGNFKREKKSDANWLILYKQLKQFKKENNSVAVPMKQDKKLSLWIRTQRKNWRDGKLPMWRRKKLEKLGWTSSNYESPTKPFKNLSDSEEMIHESTEAALSQLKNAFEQQQHASKDELASLDAISKLEEIGHGEQIEEQELQRGTASLKEYTERGESELQSSIHHSLDELASFLVPRNHDSQESPLVGDDVGSVTLQEPQPDLEPDSESLQ